MCNNVSCFILQPQANRINRYLNQDSHWIGVFFALSSSVSFYFNCICHSITHLRPQLSTPSIMPSQHVFSQAISSSLVFRKNLYNQFDIWERFTWPSLLPVYLNCIQILLMLSVLWKFRVLSSCGYATSVWLSSLAKSCLFNCRERTSPAPHRVKLCWNLQVWQAKAFSLQFQVSLVRFYKVSLDLHTEVSSRWESSGLERVRRTLKVSLSLSQNFVEYPLPL